MADPLKGLNSLFDKIDGFFGTIDSVHHTLTTGEVRKPSPAKNKVTRVTAQDRAFASRQKAIGMPTRYRLEELTDASTGIVTFLVTDGAKARCEFTDRALAEKMLGMLEASR